MDAQVINATEARVRFGELLMRVQRENRPVIVEKNGKAAVVVMSVEMYEELRAKAAPAAGDPIDDALALGRRVRKRLGEELPPPEELLRESREERHVC